MFSSKGGSHTIHRGIIIYSDDILWPTHSANFFRFWALMQLMKSHSKWLEQYQCTWCHVCHCCNFCHCSHFCHFWGYLGNGELHADWCWLMLIDANWCWLMMIGADWCWLMMTDSFLYWLIMIDDDCWWLMLMDAGLCWLMGSTRFSFVGT